MLHVMVKLKYLRCNLILKQSGFVTAHSCANLHISLLSACTFDHLPEQSTAHHLQHAQPDEAALPSLPSKFQSPHGSYPNTIQFRGHCKSEQGKDIACKKVRMRTQTDCTISKEAISQAKAFSKLSSPTQG